LQKYNTGLDHIIMQIQWHRSAGWPPVPFIGMTRMPKTLIGICLGPLVVIRSSAMADYPTLVHELEHCKQFWRGGLVVHFLRYLLSHNYRLRAELAAFAAEVVACDEHERPTRIQESARALALCYRLSLSECEAISLLGQAVSARLAQRK
jgi:hypothetical protein